MTTTLTLNKKSKLHGPRVVIILSKFLPPVFSDAMRENPEASVHMFEGNHENPELVWDDDARKKVKSVVLEMTSEFYQVCTFPLFFLSFSLLLLLLLLSFLFTYLSDLPLNYKQSKAKQNKIKTRNN